MTRVTAKTLDTLAVTLNRALGRPEQPWTRTNVRYTSNVGCIHIESQGSAYLVHEMMGTTGSVHGLYSGSAQEVAGWLRGMLAGVSAAKQAVPTLAVTSEAFCLSLNAASPDEIRDAIKVMDAAVINFGASAGLRRLAGKLRTLLRYEVRRS
jgi:hypothetical protein